jgi:protein-S-isoprenylcysteine O-methyltransferase Ste14
MKRILFLLYGVISYFIFFGTFLYAIGFVGNLFVPKSIDGAATMPLAKAVLINASLLLVFALQHSIMARPAFKRWWTRFVPEPAERSTYVLLASLCLLLMMWQWQPIGGIVWSIESNLVKTILLSTYVFGWGLVLISTFLINHFDLFGLRQTWLQFTGRKYTSLPFRTPLFYRFVRHPLYLGFLIAFWSTPVMTVAHLLFAMLTTGYILTAIVFEEKDLEAHFGESYITYKQNSSKIIPFLRRNSK